MRIFIEKKNKAGGKVYEKMENVEKIIVFDDSKAVLQINKDFTQCVPQRGQGGDGKGPNKK